MFSMNHMTTVLFGSTALAMASMSVAQDTGVKDGSFDSGTAGAWLKTDYYFNNPNTEAFEITVLSETCNDVVREGFLNLQIDDICRNCWFDESPKLWQDDIHLDDCDEGTHVILRFDRRMISDIDFNGLRVAIEAYSDPGELVGESSRRLLTGPGADCGWLTDELALEIPAVAGDLSYRVVFEMLPWGICGGAAYAEVDLDQVELFQGTPGSPAEESSAPCGAPYSGRLEIDFGAAAVETERFDSEQPERNFLRVVVDQTQSPDCQSTGGFGFCLADWPMTTEDFEPATPACVESPCPADFDGNGLVDGADLVYVLGNWGPCVDCLEDINGDDTVNGADLVYVLATWGACP
jgi:hypothetical protein